MCHGLERDRTTIHAVLTTVPSRAEVWVDLLPKGGPMRGSHGLPPSLLDPIGKRFRRQTVPHMLTPEACPTRRSQFPGVLTVEVASNSSTAPADASVRR